MQRRTFLQAGFAALLLGPTRLLAADGSTRLLSCFSDENGHYLGLLDAEGQLRHRIRLPARGHGIALHPNQRLAAVFARRPGTFVWLVDLHSGQVLQRIDAAPGRHFYGHGLFSDDGARLLCTENDYDNARGVIGVYRQTAGSWRRDSEFDSHGIGPHEVRWLSDRRTLVVANGGIATHPDLPRIKSNLDSMRPNLAYVDSHDGRLLRRFEPPARWHQLSIRHLDVAADDRVAVALQYQGNPLDQPPVIALQHDDAALRLLQPPPQVQKRLRGYCGSVRFSRDGQRFAVSSPRGGLLTLWSREGEYLGEHDQADVCGIAPGDAQQRFLLSDGGGSLQRLERDMQAKPVSLDRHLHWDNHLLEVS